MLDEDGTKFDADFAGIKLVARKATGNEFFGFYKDIASRPGEREKGLWNGFIFKEYIDHDLSYITVEGLTFQEGNQNISLVMRSEKGDGSQSSQWRRHAKLKLRVPKCRLVGVRGALGGFRVQDLNTSLSVLGEGNRDYSASLHRVKPTRLVHGRQHSNPPARRDPRQCFIDGHGLRGEPIERFWSGWSKHRVRNRPSRRSIGIFTAI